MSQTRSRSGRAFALAALAACIFLTPAAHANGRYPQANQLIVAPSDPSFLVLRATFGLLYSHDRGQTWSYSCEAVVDSRIGVEEDPSIASTATRLLAGTSNGLTTSADRGCSWQSAIPSAITDLVVRPQVPTRAFALASAGGTSDAGVFGYDSRVFGTKDDGATWLQVSRALDPTVIAETIEVAASDPDRVYVSGVRLLAGSAREGVLFTSHDGGATFTTTSFPLLTGDAGAGEGGVFIGAVDPTNPDRVYLRTAVNNPYDANSASAPNRLIVSSDGGQTFATVHTSVGKLLGFALSPDGSKLWIGGPNDDLAMASTADLVFTTRFANLRVQCLLSTSDTLFACSNDAASGPSFVVGVSHDDGRSFAPLMHLACIDTLLACSGPGLAATCGTEFTQRKSDFGGDLPGSACDDLPGRGALGSDAGLARSDAGSRSPDGGGASGDVPPMAMGGGGGCRLAPGGRASLVLEALAVLAGAAWVRRRRR